MLLPGEQSASGHAEVTKSEHRNLHLKPSFALRHAGDRNADADHGFGWIVLIHR
jgi:hypothetical protein